MCILMLLLFQGIDAGPVKVSCAGSAVTLTATPFDLGMPEPPYSVMWDGAPEPYVHHVVSPSVTTTYSVTLTVGTDIYTDETTVLVHPGDPDLHPDGQQNDDDWNVYFAAWQGPVDFEQDLDPNQDGQVNILDWFYFCNFDRNPINTPPTLSVTSPVTIVGSATTVIPTTLDDLETTPTLLILEYPSQGNAFFTGGLLRYSPPVSEGYCTDFLIVASWDGEYQSPAREVEIIEYIGDDWQNLYDDIFNPVCHPCHIAAPEGGLSLATYESAQAGGNTGPAFIPGNPEASPLYNRTSTCEMPVDAACLDAELINRIYDWISLGAIKEAPDCSSPKKSPVFD